MYLMRKCSPGYRKAELSLWPCFLHRSLAASLLKQGPKARFDFCRRWVQFVKEDSGQVAESFSWGQASCMNLTVLNNKTIKKGT